MLLESDLVPGRYVTVHGGGFAGWLIRTGTGAPVAHVYQYVGDQPGGYNIVEAEPGGVRLGHTSEYDYATSFPSKDILTPEQGAAMTKTALELVGRPYGWLADAIIGLREGLHWYIPTWLYKLKNISTHIECAQAADYIAMVNGVHYFDDNRAPGSVSPADLYHRDYK